MFLFLFFLRFRLCPGPGFLYPVITSAIAFIDLPITVLSAGVQWRRRSWTICRFVSCRLSGSLRKRERERKERKNRAQISPPPPEGIIRIEWQRERRAEREGQRGRDAWPSARALFFFPFYRAELSATVGGIYDSVPSLILRYRLLWQC